MITQTSMPVISNHTLHIEVQSGTDLTVELLVDSLSG
jgi:hypothetical protein